MNRNRITAGLIGVVLVVGSASQGTLILRAPIDPVGIVSDQAQLPEAWLSAPNGQTTQTYSITTTNQTSVAWTGYTLSLNPAGSVTFVPGSGQSTDFLTILYPDDWTINFQAPLIVPPGEMVTLEFKVVLPDGASPNLTLTQTPIPEPATAFLFGVGGLVLLASRRRSADGTRL